MNRKGFSLLEVLVAILVLEIAMGLIIALFAGGLRSISLMKGYSEALLLAREKMDEGLAMGGLEGDGNEGLEEDYRWERRVKPFSLTEESAIESEADLLQVEVNVYWDEGSKEKEVSLQGLVAVSPSNSEFSNAGL